jgi:hypothetical protein
VEASAKTGITCGFHHSQCINPFAGFPNSGFSSLRDYEPKAENLLGEVEGDLRPPFVIGRDAERIFDANSGDGWPGFKSSERMQVAPARTVAETISASQKLMRASSSISKVRLISAAPVLRPC